MSKQASSSTRGNFSSAKSARKSSSSPLVLDGDVVKLRLEAERTELGAKSEPQVKAYNARATELEARVTSWNQRNEGWNQTIQTMNAERTDWVKECADRRFREDDEIARHTTILARVGNGPLSADK